MEVVLSLRVLVHNTTASLKQIALRSRLTEIWLTASSGRSSSSSSACRRGKGIGQGHVTRTRNIGYILRLAGGGWLASQSPSPLKGGAALEGVDYFNLWEESGTEDKWLLRDTENKWQHRLAEWMNLVVKAKCLIHDTMRRWVSGKKTVLLPQVNFNVIYFFKYYLFAIFALQINSDLMHSFMKLD